MKKTNQKSTSAELMLQAVKLTKPRAFAVKGGVHVHEDKRKKVERKKVREASNLRNW